MQSRIAIVRAAVLALVTGLASGAAQGAPRADLWERWTRHDPASTRSVNHDAWEAFLARHLSPGPDGVNRVDYAAVDDASRSALEGYLERLAATPVSQLSRAEQQAFWINLYNALTVKVVLDHYPVASIRDIDISPGLFSSGPWGAKLVEVEGESLSLDDIEHRILRPIWRDPRIHYAVNCASIGCPNLASEAFTADNAERLLEAGARAYVNHPRGVSVQGDALVVSSIYEWFKEDFGGDDAGVIEHLRAYADDSLAGKLAGAARIEDDRYDWALNDRP